MTPIAHTIVGVWLGDVITDKLTLKDIFVFALISSLPDIDMIFQIMLPQKTIHQIYTHNIFFVALTTFMVYLIYKNKKMAKFAIFALFSHLILDIFVEDFKAPYGVPLFFPLTDFTFTFPIFPTFYKASLKDVFSLKNLKPIIVELLIFSPFLYFVIYDWKNRKN